MAQTRTYLCLDVGERRIGVAVGDSGVRIAVPFAAVEVDGTEVQKIAEIYLKERATAIVVGYPRNQSGEATAQTAYVERFAGALKEFATVIFQDESLTSVLAEQQLLASKKPYSKGDIDAQAAALILQDFLETRA